MTEPIQEPGMVEPQVLPFTVGMKVISGHDNEKNRDIDFLRLSLYHMSGTATVFFTHDLATQFLAGFRTTMREMKPDQVNGKKLYLPNKGIIRP